MDLTCGDRVSEGPSEGVDLTVQETPSLSDENVRSGVGNDKVITGDRAILVMQCTALKDKSLNDIHANISNETPNNTNHNADVTTKGSNAGAEHKTDSIKLVLHTFI